LEEIFDENRIECRDDVCRYILDLYNYVHNIENIKKTKESNYYNDYLFDDYNKNKEIYINTENIKVKIKKEANIYNLKINISNIPIIIIHYKYEKNNYKAHQLIPFFDINKYFYKLFSYINKYNLSFNIKNQKEMVNTFSPKVTLNKAFHNKYLKICLESNKNDKKGNINKEIKMKTKKKIINKEDNINSIINNLYKKNKKTKSYKIRLKTNKYIIKMYSDIFNIKDELNEDDVNELYNENHIKDTNISRVFIKSEIYNKIYNNNNIYNSDNIINIGLIDKINKSDIELFIYKLELFCKGENIEKIFNIDKIANTENDEDGLHIIDDVNILKNLNVKLL
jgi:hypothetical protein